MRIKNQADFETGLFFSAFGAITTYLAGSYRLGTAAAMGPGYFPRVLGILILCLGLGFILKSLSTAKPGQEKSGQAPLRVPLRSACLIVGSLMLFALTVNWLGMVVAIPLIVAVSAFAGPKVSLREVVILSVCLVGISYIIFSLGLGVPMRVHPWS